MEPDVAVKGILDRVPVAVRDAVLMFVSALLLWAAGAAQGVVVADNPLLTGVLSSAAVTAVGSATLWFTKIQKAYGKA